jgi:predicted phage tail protein
VSASTVTLTWTASPDLGPTLPNSYTIEVGSAPGLRDLATFSAGTSVTTFTATNVGPGVYYVRVRAYGFLRVSAPSNEVIVIVGGPSPCFAAPAPPGSFAGAVSGSTVSLTWTASSGPVDSYIVEAGQTIGVWNTRLDTATSATGLTVTNVPNGSYFVRVRGKNTCGVGAPSNEAVVTVP